MRSSGRAAGATVSMDSDSEVNDVRWTAGATGAVHSCCGQVVSLS